MGAERIVAAIAADQQGAISVLQLRWSGLDRGAVADRVRRGVLHPIHRGVYAVGHARLSPTGQLWADVLAAGPGAAISHRTAAWQHALLPAPSGATHVLVPRHRRHHAGLLVHRSGSYDPGLDATRTSGGLPVTTVARTLVDLRPRDLPRALRTAEVNRLLDVAAVDAVLGRLPHRADAVHRALAALRPDDVGLTDSELEELALDRIRAAGLPPPLVNQTIEGCRRDLVWPEHRLVVELDGRAAHLTPWAFEDDRRRDAELTPAGWRVVRFTHHTLVHDPGHLVRTLRPVLGGARR